MRAAKGWSISKATVCRIVREVSERRKARLLGGENPRKSCPRPVRSKNLFQKVEACVKRENPILQRAIARKYQVSKETVSNIIRQDFNLESKRKPRVHTLHVKHIKERPTAESYTSAI